MQSIGGFFTAIKLVFSIVLQLFNGWSIEKYLVRQLYKISEKSNKNSPKSQTIVKYKQLIEEAKAEVKHRKHVKARFRSPIFTFIQSLFAKFCVCMRYDENDWYYLKARSKLAKELDIQRLIKNLMKMKTQMKFLTTST